MKVPRLDIERIIAVFGGGANECAAALQSVGYQVDVRRVRKWIARDSLPMDGWLMLSLAHGATTGMPLDLNCFVKG